jgi:acyl-CoA synthetase (AMP-forming)/AMP-acid ligase II
MPRASEPQCGLLHQLIASQAAAHPSRTALWWQGEATDYASLNRHVLAVAGRLASGNNIGERVAVLAWNCPEFIELIYGVPAAGNILVPLNARLAPAEWIYQLQSSGATILLATPRCYNHCSSTRISHRE